MALLTAVTNNKFF